MHSPLYLRKKTTFSAVSNRPPVLYIMTLKQTDSITLFASGEL
jgi:hypothetical protein